MSQSDDPSRNLLFGLLALQVGLIDQARLVAAFQAWTLDRSRSLADHLVGLGGLEAGDREAVEALVVRHLQKHGGSAEKSLAAVPVGRSVCTNLAGMGDPDLETTLGHIGTAQPGTMDGALDPDRTCTYSVGLASSNGQRFRILRPHARGGLGAVFVALDTELHREVALKQILDAHADDPVSRTRFVIEAEITGGLEHPGIVPVYGLGSDGDGRPYYAMRFIRGDSLKDSIRLFHADPDLKSDTGRHSLELRKLLRRFTDVCNAIEYAHSRGVLHRDIKPANVIVGRYGETLVVDWGLAKAIGRVEPGSVSGERTLKPSSASGSAETLPGSALGTPAYMSPEQAEGNLEHLGPRSDVYSLGATLYCLLTGEPPFAGEAADVIRAVQRGEFRPPRQLDARIDPALEAICNKAMAHKLADRYPTSRALADDVEKWMADEPVSAWREPFSLRARRWARKHRTMVAAAAAAVLVALAGTGAVLAVQTQGKHALAVSNQELTRANDQLRLANGREGAARGRAQARFDLAKKAIEAYYTGASEDVLLKQPELEGLRKKLLQTALEFYRELGADLDADREAGLEPKAARELARANFRVAWISNEIGDASQALAAFRQSLEMCREIMRVDPGDRETRCDAARCLTRIGWALLNTGRADESISPLRESNTILERLLEERPEDVLARDALAWNVNSIAYQEMRTGHDDEALKSFQKALEIRRGLANERPDNLEFQINVANSLHDVGMLAQRNRHEGEAVDVYRQALELKKKLADAHPELSKMQDSLAGLYNDMANAELSGQRRTEAIRLYRESLAIREKLIRAHPTIAIYQARTAWGHYNLGLAHLHEGRWVEGTDCLGRARTLVESLARANPSVVDYQQLLASTRFSLGYVSRRLDRRAEAENHYHAARAGWERLAQAEPSNPGYRADLANCSEALALLLESQGKGDQAVAAQQTAIVIRGRLVQDYPKSAEDRHDLATSQFHLADLLVVTGQVKEALEVQHEALAVREELARVEPVVYKGSLADDYTRIAGLEVTAGRPGEALARLKQASAILDSPAGAGPSGTFARVEAEMHLVTGTALEASGDLAGAVRAYERCRALTEGRRVLYSGDHVQLARAYARKSALAARQASTGASDGEGDGESQAAKAVQELRRAIEAHYELCSRLARHPDLQSLWPRADFRLVLMDIAFPPDPFAR
jgi:eukaryotic-like serine/threonine-protein kinase